MSTTTDTPEIQPALSLAQWAYADHLLAEHAPGWIQAGEHHAVAALCLHEQPFGFGWPDHDLLVDLADTNEQQAKSSEDMVNTLPVDRSAALWTTDAAAHRRRAADLRSIAVRIAALLAPR